jgi:hypothetical protein
MKIKAVTPRVETNSAKKTRANGRKRANRAIYFLSETSTAES